MYLEITLLRRALSPWSYLYLVELYLPASFTNERSTITWALLLLALLLWKLSQKLMKIFEASSIKESSITLELYFIGALRSVGSSLGKIIVIKHGMVRFRNSILVNSSENSTLEVKVARAPRCRLVEQGVCSILTVSNSFVGFRTMVLYEANGAL
ncbi:hypothetical protein CsSME_00003781 [Camellia sinensis var. sinensis]